MIEVLPVGTPVTLGHDDPFEANVTAVCIREGGYVTYELTWWSGRDRRCEWMAPSEFAVAVADAGRKLVIGFKPAYRSPPGIPEAAYVASNGPCP